MQIGDEALHEKFGRRPHLPQSKFTTGRAHYCQLIYVIVIPGFVGMYVEIIHELKRVDYLPYRWSNNVITYIIPPTSV